MTDKKEITKESLMVDHVINVRRVTKVTKGGKRFSFVAFVIIPVLIESSGISENSSNFKSEK